MVSPKEIKLGSTTEAKAKSDGINPFIHYICRPISYVIAAPLVEMKVTATQVTVFSLLPALLCIPFIALSQSVVTRFFGGMLWGFWAILDCVDGAIARYTHSESRYGEMWDATCGYIITWAWPISVGMAAYLDNSNSLVQLPVDAAIYVFIGGLASICAIFPRLLMHRAYTGDKKAGASKYRDKTQFGKIKQFVSIIINPVGMPIYLFFISTVFHFLNLMIIFYFIIFVAFGMVSSYQILHDVRKSEAAINKGDIKYVG